MVKNFYPLFLFLFSFSIVTACDETTPEQQALERSLHGKRLSSFVEIPAWLGIYQDTLPCDHCKGILTRLDLRSDTTYKKSCIYLGKEPVFDNTFSTTGKWIFDPVKKRIMLDSAIEGRRFIFALDGDSALLLCDLKGNLVKAASHRMPRL